MASSISTAVTVTLWQHRSEYHHAVLTEHVKPASQAATQYIDALHDAGFGITRSWAMLDGAIEREALTMGVNDVFWGCMVLFVVLIPVVWLARPPFTASGAPGH
jgi:DHA2 family multidrug resistance protein